MEIEAKFAIPDRDTFEQLRSVSRLNDYELSAGELTIVQDEYLDTAERALLAAGYACRRRNYPEGLVMTLKGLGSAAGAIHRREEYETRLPADQPPEAWPPGPVRDRVLAIINQAPLRPLFSLSQTRLVRQIERSQQVVAQFSLDDVGLSVAGAEQAYFELEIEQTQAGSEADLISLAAYLQSEWHLQPEPRSKFERALAFVEAVTPVEMKTDLSGRLLTAAERAILQQLVRGENHTYNRRALALLALDAGASSRQAGQQAGLSAGRVRYWRRRFQEKRLQIFPPPLLAQNQVELSGQLPAATLLSASPQDVASQAEAAGINPDQALPVAEPLPASIERPDKPGLTLDDTMAEAARKTLWFHFQRMLEHEPETRRGKDIEALHDMRVATRRMRAAYQISADYLDEKELAPFLKSIRRTARILGAVRDLDVFWEKAEHYLKTLPEGQQTGLDALQAIWSVRHKVTRAELLNYLDGAKYQRFKEKFARFLQQPNAGALPLTTKKSVPRPHCLRDIIPIAIYQRLAEVQAYNAIVAAPQASAETLHQLRIACKGLRYTLEFFQEGLGAEAKEVVQHIKTLQNHLGDLQDAVVAIRLLRSYLFWGAWDYSPDDKTAPSDNFIIDPGVTMYLVSREAEYQTLLETFPEAWANFQGAHFKEQLAAMIAKL